MKFEFHPEALSEYEDAAHYYASCQTGLDLRFMSAIEFIIQQITEAPQRWPIIEEDIRRCLARVFPYAILYTIEKDYVLILSVMHCHREPGYWRNRTANN